jgi:hypothetical protein
MLPHSYVYQMLEPLRDERKLNAENLDVLQSNYAVAAVGRHGRVLFGLWQKITSDERAAAHGLNVTTSKSLNLCVGKFQFKCHLMVHSMPVLVASLLGTWQRNGL